MSPKVPPSLRIVQQLLPSAERETVVADLCEEVLRHSPRRAHGWMVWQVLGIAVRYQTAVYIDAGDRVRVLALLGASLGLLWSVPAAASIAIGTAESFGMELAVAIWRAPHVTAAIAAGLLVGRGLFLPAHLLAARGHVGVLAVCTAWIAFGWASALAAAVAAALASVGQPAGRSLSQEDLEVS